MTWLLGSRFLRPALFGFAAAALLGAAAWLFSVAEKSGAAKQAAKTASETVEKAKELQDANADARQSPVVDRLRGGIF